MKRTILPLALILFSTMIFAQNAFYDAITIKNNTGNKLIGSGKFQIRIPPGEIDSRKDLFVRYGLKIDPTDDGDQIRKKIKKLFENNPFINVSGSGQSSDFSSQSITAVKTLPSSSGIGGLNVTNLADGLAKFLVDRAKQELSITFFQKFIAVLEDPKNKDFTTLFPKTHDVLIVIDKEVYQFSNYINTLREAFEKDLQIVLTTLESFLEAKKTSLFANNLNDPIGQKIEYFESALLIVNNLRQGVHPAEAIGKLEYQTYHQNNTPLLNIQEAVKLFTVFSNSLKSKDSDSYWVDSKSLKSLMDPITFKIYLGLLYQLHGNDMVFGKKFSDYLDQVAKGTVKIEKYKEYVEHLILDSEKITLAINSAKQKIKSGEKVTSYKELFQSTLSFLKNLKDTKNLNIAINLDKINEVWSVLDMLNNVYLDVNERKYNALILDLSSLLTELLGPDNFKWKNELIKYGTFIANVAQAENSNEVQSAIEAIALPVGSASIKKKTKSNIALNAYVGLSPGLEHNGKLGEYKFSFGINAPIGIALSKGEYKLNEKTNKYKEKGSTTWFLSLLDLGAVTTYRFGDSETEKLPEIKLENIFAPGIYYVRGFAKAPISIGVGGQLGPQLRTITDSSLNLNSSLSFSFKIFIAVDIPLLNFHTKSR
ncbi:MAG: hypothetical protein JXQ93_10185 [Flavobacteriaceae bacterium]